MKIFAVREGKKVNRNPGPLQKANPSHKSFGQGLICPNRIDRNSFNDSLHALTDSKFGPGPQWNINIKPILDYEPISAPPKEF